ncbi:MAG: hypothetical protein JWP19_2329 [Rhodoglobus sp.]|nr:hypothetical protein [Rhodoglobus sp.]
MPGQLETPSLTDSLSAALRERILSGEVASGTRITEAWVTAEFAVARPTAKASLERLTKDGILRKGARKSAIVPTFSAEDIRDIYYSRESVELRAVLTLTETKTVPEEARRALRSMERATEDADLVDHAEADITFHRALVEAVRSPRLQRMHETIMGEAQLCIAQVQRSKLTDLEMVTREHSAILVAVASGDSIQASLALGADLHGARDRLLGDLEA